MTDEQKAALIRQHNDALRTMGTARNGRIIITGDLLQEVEDRDLMTKVIFALKTFDAFNEDNDPHGEHDCAKFTVDDEEFMFKVDYFALDEETLSPNPEDPNVTIRILSVFYARDY